MHFVLLATHTPESCPTSNAKTQEAMLSVAPQVQNIAETCGVKIVSGPFVNREHLIFAVLTTDRPENIDRFLVDTRLAHWNSVRVLPSLTMEEGMAEIQASRPMF